MTPKQFTYYIPQASIDTYPFLGKFKITENLYDDFQIIIFLPEVIPDAFLDKLFQTGKAIMPILKFGLINNSETSSPGCPSVDYQADHFSKDQFTKAIQLIRPLLEQLANLPDFSLHADHSALSILAMAYSRKTEIQAHWAPNTQKMVYYPLLRGIPNTDSFLQELVNLGCLKQRIFDRLHLCSVCQSSRLNVREECPSCNSSNVQEEAVVHHYSCAYQDVETDFIQNTELICPKCDKKLRHYGVDYDKPGTMYICHDCQQSNTEPEVGFVCTDCNHHMAGDTIGTRSWYHYTITSNGVAALETGMLPHHTVKPATRDFVGAYSQPDFVQRVDTLHKVAQRYLRPLICCSLKIDNLDMLKDKHGPRGVSEIFRWIGDIVTQNLRHTDLLTAQDQTLYLCLPETPHKQVELLINRVSQQVEKNFNTPIVFKYYQYTNDQIEELLKQLQHVH